MKINWKYSLVAALLLIPFLYAMWFTFPLGDDFFRSNKARCLFDIWGGIREMSNAYWKWSGRFTHHFMVIFLGDVVLSRATYALACTALLVLYLGAFYGIFNTIQGGKERGNSIFAAFFCTLSVYSGHQALNITYYLVTDLLGLGLGNGLLLLFIWALCHLWFAPEPNRNTIVCASLSGVLTIGCYEHAAIAALFTAAIALGMAHLYNHPHKKAFLTVFKWVGVFFLLSLLSRGNFRRESKRGVTLELILSQVSMAWNDWLSYGFWVFRTIFPVTALVIGMLLRPRWQLSLGKRLPWPMVLAMGAFVYILLSAGIVLLQAVSDVSIGKTSKLPASLALLEGYLLGLLALACGDGPRRVAAHIPACVLVAPPLILICCSFNMRQTVKDLVSGRTAAYAAIQERRFGWLRDPEAQKETPAVVEDLRLLAFPSGQGETFQFEVSDWPNRNIAKMFKLHKVHCMRPQAATALAASKELKNALELAVPEALKNKGVARIHLLRQITGGPNSTFSYDWLFIQSSTPLASLTTLTFHTPGGQRLIPVFIQQLLTESALRNKELTADAPSAFIGYTQSFHAPEWVVDFGPKNLFLYGIPFHLPESGSYSGLYLAAQDSVLYRIR